MSNMRLSNLSPFQAETDFPGTLKVPGHCLQLRNSVNDFYIRAVPAKVRDSFCNMSDIEESNYWNLSVLLLYATTTHYLYYQLL